MSCLLFVDDDKNILDINRDFFTARGYTVYIAFSAAEAEEYLWGFPVDCIILDILMPDMDGLETCKKIRERKSVPILFLTGLTQQEFLYRGFSLGCDDFMTKPYDPVELEMRIIALVKRYKGAVLENLRLDFGALVIDECKRLVTVNDREVALTTYEFDILLTLAKHPEQVLSIQEIYHEVWKLPDLGSAQTVQGHLARMRQKLETASPECTYIKTVWKLGYRFTFDGDKKKRPLGSFL